MTTIKKVHVVRSGGFAGLHRSRDIAGESLKPTQAKALQRLFGAGAPARPPGADRFTYDFEVQDASGKVSRLEVAEGAVPRALMALLP